MGDRKETHVKEPSEIGAARQGMHPKMREVPNASATTALFADQVSGAASAEGVPQSGAGPLGRLVSLPSAGMQKRRSRLLWVQRRRGNAYVQLAVQRQRARSGDRFEREAESIAEAVGGDGGGARPRLSAVGLQVQRVPVEGSSAPAATPTPAATQAGGARAGDVRRALIVEDDATELETGQMKKSAFLAELREAACRTADEALTGTIWSTVGCPYVARWLSYYRGREAGHVERAIRRFAPETAGVSTARGYIPLICVRVRAGVERWRITGEVPAGVAAMPPTGGGEEGGGLISGLVSAGARIVGGLLFKERGGGAKRGSLDPRVVQAELGEGQGLEGGLRSRMEAAFGMGFGGVRVHRDGKAASLTAGMNARAFTVGKDIAFGRGEYRPGTLVGDALIAHELAHVVQQGGGLEAGEPVMKGEAGVGVLEADADQSAVGAVLSLLSEGRMKLADMGERALPRLRTGLQLQACRRTVKRCPRGMQWTVRTEFGEPQAVGTGPVCWCVWRCRPAPEPPPPPNSVTCYPRPCSRPSIEYVDEEHEIRSQAGDQPDWVIGPGGHFTPLTGQATCGCIPLDIEGGEQSGAPMIRVGFQATDVAGMRGRPARDPRTGQITPGAVRPQAGAPPRRPAAAVAAPPTPGGRRPAPTGRRPAPPPPPTVTTPPGGARGGLPGATGTRHLPRGFSMPRRGRTNFPSTRVQMGTPEQRAAGRVRTRGERVRRGEVGTQATGVPRGRSGVRDHWREHGREFPEYRNARQYEQGAIDFCRAPTTRRFYYRHEGRPTIGYYNTETNTFAATSVDGTTIYTYFRPQAGVQAYVQNIRTRGVPPGVQPRHSTPVRREE